MKEYEVIKANTLNHQVGDIVELSEAKAASLVNKVKPVPPKKPVKKSASKQPVIK